MYNSSQVMNGDTSRCVVLLTKLYEMALILRLAGKIESFCSILIETE